MSVWEERHQVYYVYLVILKSRTGEKTWLVEYVW